jgi:four helix bundle protein
MTLTTINKMKNDKDVLKDKSFNFAIRMVHMYQFLSENKKEFILSKQCLRSGTAIGALVHEAAFGQSKADFINKLSIGLKEANETSYWLALLKETKYLDNKTFVSVSADCQELIKILASIIITAKKSLNDK